ncbi:MAG: Bax inhibitor-1/YccA family protein [Bacteroidales bacterium]|nr:Bax inhibitor-1/YccA family protein [Bacteroidales bacterium]
MNEDYGYGVSSVEKVATNVNKVMRLVYVKMLLAMLVTAVTSMYVTSNETLLMLIYGKPMVFVGLLISQVIVVISLLGRLQKMSTITASLLFYLYSVLTGVVFASILLVYTATSIANTFFITAGVFGAMSVYGYFTSNDLSKMGSLLIMGFLGLIICSVVNIFLKSQPMEWLISFVGVLVFIGLTAWDTQKIKAAAAHAEGDDVKRLATIGALELYLDFVNLFIYLLRFFGNDRK